MDTKTHSVPKEPIRQFCQKWKVVELALFGSILRDDFAPESDVDVLVTFSSTTSPSLFDLAQMQLELQEIFGRPVDLVEKNALKNPYRKTEILTTAQVVYAA